MNLLGYRQGLFDWADWDGSPSPLAVARCDRFINRAIKQIANDFPVLFHDEMFYVRTQADVAPTLVTDTITIAQDVAPVASNAWTFRVNLPPLTTGAVVWDRDRTWDGRYIEITDVNGVKRVNRIRTVFLDNVDNRMKFTLWTPWNLGQWGEGPFATWRIYTAEYFLPDDLIEIKSIKIRNQDVTSPVQLILQGDAEDYGLDEHTGQNAASAETYPLAAYRRRHQQIRGPTVAPTITYGPATASALSWLGPDPQGTFQYTATYCWGKRPPDYANPGPGYWLGNMETLRIGTGADEQGFNPQQTAAGRASEPIFESSPSPASIVAAPGVVGTAGQDIRIQVPNVEYMLGFLAKGSRWTGAPTGWERAHAYMSGWFVRLYRKRLTAITGAGTVYGQLPGFAVPGGQNYFSTFANPDFDDSYYLLSEIRIDSSNQGMFIDNGQITPDYHRELRDIHGYQSIRFSPRPAAEYEVEIRGTRRPQALVSPYDVPKIHSDLDDLVIARAAMYLADTMEDPNMKIMAERDYSRLLSQASKRYGLGLASSQVISKRPMRLRWG